MLYIRRNRPKFNAISFSIFAHQRSKEELSFKFKKKTTLNSIQIDISGFLFIFQA